MDPRPLTALFVDCDSFFASVEQHLDPALCGRPVGVAPVLAETSCCIAASYEAKAFGVKTGTGIREARALCPDIAIVQSKPAEYIRIHHRIVAAVEDCIHVEAVLSIDEMWAWLPYNLREPQTVHTIGRRIKDTVAQEVSPVVKVSVGAAPNRWLAKMASKMRKPDGLFLIEAADLPQALHPLALRDLHGIAGNMESRLHAAGIHSTAALCAAPKAVLHSIWGGVLGSRLWHLLRGDEVPELVSSRKSIGHSHVLPPDSRTPDQAWGILCKLTHKAGERLRAHGLLAGKLVLTLAYLGKGRWDGEHPMDGTDASLTLLRHLRALWRARPDPRARLLQVGVVLTRLQERACYTPPLFPDEACGIAEADPERMRRLDTAIDQLRARYGRKVVYFGSVQDERESAPMRISFTHIPDLDLEND